MIEAVRDQLEAQFLELPVIEFAYLKTEQVTFPERVRYICKNECPRYGTTWSCPPAVGTVEECKAKVLEYPDCFVFSTIAEVPDITNMEGTLATRMPHEEITQEITEIFRNQFGKVLTLSTESCDICAKCAYPDAPCRHPEKMYPCVESYSILVTDLAEKGGMTFDNGANVVTWFSVIFFDGEKSSNV